VLGEIQQIDAAVDRAVERYNAATAQLAATKSELRINRQALHVARASLKHAQGALAQRLVAIYKSNEDRSTLGVVLGATSLDDLLSRVESVQNLTRQDSRIIRQVVVARVQIRHHQRVLENARRVQARAVAVRAAEKAHIEGQLRERQSLLSRIRGEISRLEAQDRARQRALAAAARARYNNSRSAPQGFGITAETPDGTVAPPSQYGGVVGIAMRYLGVPYVWGGASPSGFDCSGFVMYVYAQMGVSLPHYTGAQWNSGVPVSRDQLQSGDLVFFNGLGHVGIYIGGGQFIHAPHTGDVVKISSLGESWYAATYDGARRITG
jgi:cell wall-associated NlpC family hydrolase